MNEGHLHLRQPGRARLQSVFLSKTGCLMMKVYERGERAHAQLLQEYAPASIAGPRSHLRQ
jgi:hypothetical protein